MQFYDGNPSMDVILDAWNSDRMAHDHHAMGEGANGTDRDPEGKGLWSRLREYVQTHEHEIQAAVEVSTPAGRGAGLFKGLLARIFGKTAPAVIPRTASGLIKWAESQKWVRTQTPAGPIKYVDENGIVRVTIKQGSSRAPGSAGAHVELRNASGQRVNPEGDLVTRRSPENHTPIDWDLDH
jgi:hypothetical protein